MYMKPGMGDGGACHPRDNIALRHLANRLNLGYDLFDAVMLSREKQAENMADKLLELSQKNSLPIVIVGKAYKPLVPYEAGSSSMLVGHYVEEKGGRLFYLDELTGDAIPDDIGPAVYLLAHDPRITYGSQLEHVQEWYKEHDVSEADEAWTVATASGNDISFVKGSIIVDPWRKVPDIRGCDVIHYGNTRQN